MVGSEQDDDNDDEVIAVVWEQSNRMMKLKW